jgi:DNA-binding transcriptional MocR family regulator
MDLVTAIGDWSLGDGRLHQKLARAIEGAIRAGRLGADGRVPSERSLARRLSVSRSTVVAAYSDLRSRGVLEARQGSGTYVDRSARAVLARVDTPTKASPIYHRLLADNAGASDVVSFAAAFVPPCDALDEAMAQAVRADLPRLRAGSGYQPLGVVELRAAVAHDFTVVGFPTAANDVLITTGAQQALNLCAGALVRPGDRVLVEDPTYPGTIDAFAAAGARLVPLPVDHDGVDVGGISEAIERHRPVAICVSPTFHNPTGALLAAHRRRTLAEAAAETGVVVVEDHALSYLRLDAAEIPLPIAAFAPPDAGFIVVGSASKMFWSGLRTGWIRAPEPWLSRIARRKVAADLGSALFDQAVTARLLEARAEIQVALTSTLRERLSATEAALSQRFDGWEWTTPTGGSSLWVRLPTSDTESFSQVALRHGVEVVPGTAFSVSARFADRTRIPFTLEPRLRDAALERLSAAWDGYAMSASRRPEPSVIAT